MSYMQELEAELRARIDAISDAPDDDKDAFVSYLKAVVLESYRNGLKAPRKASADQPSA
jgi:hypothetical protein